MQPGTVMVRIVGSSVVVVVVVVVVEVEVVEGVGGGGGVLATLPPLVVAPMRVPPPQPQQTSPACMPWAAQSANVPQELPHCGPSPPSGVQYWLLTWSAQVAPSASAQPAMTSTHVSSGFEDVGVGGALPPPQTQHESTTEVPSFDP